MGTRKERIKQAIRDELLGRFFSRNAQEGDTLAEDWLHEEFMPSLSKKEEQALEEVLAEMIAEGLIEHVHGRRPTFRLTAKGRTAAHLA